MKKIASIFAFAILLLTSFVLNVLPAQAASSDLKFSNSSANRSSFDCYWRESDNKTWHKLNDGDSKVINRDKNAVKCDHSWYMYSFGGRSVLLKGNTAYSTANKFNYPLDWVVARDSRDV